MFTTRRQLLQVASAGLLGVLGLTSTTPAHAGEDMCDGDPILLIKNHLVQMVVQVPKSALAWVTPSNPISITVYVPRSTTSSNLSGNLLNALAQADPKAQATLQGILGPVPERVTFVTVDQKIKGQVASIQFRVDAPQPAGTPAYAVVVTVRSTIDSVALKGTSAASITGAIRIPWS